MTSRTALAGALLIVAAMCQGRAASADAPILYAPGKSSVRHAAANSHSRQVPDSPRAFSGRRIYDLSRYTPPPSGIYEYPTPRYGGRARYDSPFPYGYGYGYWPGSYWGPFYPYGGFYYPWGGY